MSYRVTQFDCEREIRRLEAAGYRVPDVGIERTARVWTKVMEGVGPKSFTAAVDEYLRSDSRWWPKPGAIRQLAFEVRARDPKARPTDLRSRYLRWEQSQEDGCPVCGAAVQLVGPGRRGVPQKRWNEETGRLEDGEAGEGRLWVVHDAERHRQEGVPWVGPPYVEPGAKVSKQKSPDPEPSPAGQHGP